MGKRRISIFIQDRKGFLLICFLVALLAFISGYIISLDPDWVRIEFNLTRPKHLYAFILGFISILLILKKPEIGLLLLVALLYGNASEAFARYHSMPSILQLLVLLLLITIIIQKLILRKQEFVTDPMIVFLITYGALILVSSTRAVNTSLADQNLFEFSKNLLIFLIIINLISNRETLRQTAWVMIIVGGLMATISVYQVFTASYSFEFGGFGRIKIAHITGEYWNPRIAGPLADPNFYAQILVVLVPVAIYRLWDESSSVLKILSAYCLAVIILALVFTYSRGASLALGLVIFMSIINKRIKLRYILLLLLIFLPLIIFVPGQFKGRLNTLDELLPGQDESKIHLDSSFQQRILYMKTAWVMFSDNPFLGVGSGNYSEHYDKYSEQVGSIVSSYEDFGKPRLPHSLYLQIASETGIIGFIIFISIIFLTLMNFLSSYKRFKKVGDYDSGSIVISFMFGFIGYLISSFFLHGDYIRYFWLLVAIAVAANHISQNFVESRIPSRSISNYLSLITK